MYAFQFLVYHFLLYSHALHVDLSSLGALPAVFLYEGTIGMLDVPVFRGLSLTSQEI